jgi:hypothetical protein
VKLPESFAAAVEGLALVRTGSPALGWARIERALALAGELGNRYAELAAGALAVEALVELGRWESARAALARMRDLATAASNHEHDGRFDRLEAALDVLTGAPGAGDRLATLVANARTPADRAQALRWLAQHHLQANQPDATTLTAAEEQAKAAGLVALPAELALLAGEQLLARDQAMFAGLTMLRGLEIAQKLKLAPLEARLQAALAAADPSHAPQGQQARSRYKTMVASFQPAEREAYARLPGHQRLH